MKIQCEQCQASLDIPDSAAGAPVACPSCKAVFTAPLFSAQPTNKIARYRTAASSGLLDIEFRTFISPTLISILYVLGLIGLFLYVMIVLGTTGYSLVSSRISGPQVLGATIVSVLTVVGACFSLAMLRVSCESALVLFRIEEHLRKR